MTYMYSNTQLAEQEDDQTLFIHGYKINDQLRRGLRFQIRILHRQRRSEVESVTGLYIRRSKRRKARKESIERKRDSSSSDLIKSFPLNRPTTHSTVLLRTGYRQNASPIRTKTSPIQAKRSPIQTLKFTVSRPYPFRLGNKI